MMTTVVANKVSVTTIAFFRMRLFTEGIVVQSRSAALSPIAAQPICQSGVIKSGAASLVQ